MKLFDSIFLKKASWTYITLYNDMHFSCNKICTDALLLFCFIGFIQAKKKK